jgi:DNA-binding MarR family transcriptional regulator
MKTPIGSRGGEASLIVLIKNLHQALRGALDEALRDIEQTLPQQAVMATLVRMPGASNADLARAAFVSPQSMAELLQSLEEKSWVTRSPSPANARILQTKVTPAGTRALARAGAELAKVEERLTAALSSGEQKELRSLLVRCLETLRC